METIHIELRSKAEISETGVILYPEKKETNIYQLNGEIEIINVKSNDDQLENIKITFFKPKGGESSAPLKLQNNTKYGIFEKKIIIGSSIANSFKLSLPENNHKDIILSFDLVSHSKLFSKPKISKIDENPAVE